MIKLFTTTIVGLIISLVAIGNDYSDAWNQIHKKHYSEAALLLEKATNNPSTALDAYCTLLYLKSYQGKESEISGLTDAIMNSKDKNSYLYATWFNGSILGEYSRKLPYQLELLNKLESDNTINGSIKAASHYTMALSNVFSNNYAKGKEDWNQMGALMDWQYTGPFENISGTGFNMRNGPLDAVDTLTSFKGMNDVDVKWFTPIKTTHEGWCMCYPTFKQSTAIVFTQTFVYSPKDIKVLLNAGVNGSIKVWVNDANIIAESKERKTELDYYKNYCSLKKGYNRVLVQIGYSNNTNPNFIIRFTDDSLMPINDLASTSQVQPYSKDISSSSTNSLKHFAEECFEKKIVNDPSNLINYILLCQIYLRNSRITEARVVIEKGLKISSEDPLLKFELMQILIKAEDRTNLLQEADWVKVNDPESYLNHQMKIQTLISGEKYTEANDATDEMLNLFGEDEAILQLKATVLSKLEKIDELVKVIDKGYQKYPSNQNFVLMMFRVKKLINKDTKAALDIYNQYFKNNYDYTLMQNMILEYKDLGQDSMYVSLIKKVAEIASQDPQYVSVLSNYYYEKRDFIKALAYAKEASSLAPYVGLYWHNLATIDEQLMNKDEAIKFYRKAIYYNRTDYDARKKLTLLLNEQEPYKLLPNVDIYPIIKNTPVDSSFDYTFLLDQKGSIIYDEGAWEEYVTYAVKINTQKGIDDWKEINLPNNSLQPILVEKCEVVKANGAKVDAERNEGTVVFTGLQAGDAIYVKYRLQNLEEGKIGRAFWDRFDFNAFVNSLKESYTLIVPKTLPFNSKVINNTIDATVKEVGNNKIYTWQINNLPALKSEPLMPPINDIASVLHISTIKTWDEISDWYSNVSFQDTKDNFEIEDLYNEIFRNKTNENDFAKTKRIYDYIVSNIRYSSLSFRQNGYKPQQISKIINTKLGDCKDLVSLFVALTARAGIKAQFVLIDTRDNGSKDLQLPCMEFNHCISLVHIQGKDYYIELTDSNLPFGSLPMDLNGALSLIIPSFGEKSDAVLLPLVALNRTPDKLIRMTNVVINGNDLKLNVESKRYGSIISAWKNDYATLNSEKQKENYEQMLSSGNKNPVKLESLSFIGLTGPNDSLDIKSNYTIKNEVISAGSMSMIKVPFIDLVATLESLSADKRKYPIEYWNYENIDAYETFINIEIPAGKKLLEYPPDINLHFKKSTYSLKFVQNGNQLKITRLVNMERNDIKPEDYDEFKKFFNDIVEAESKYVVFK
jgi:Transglutaminase-like enzymes, putative cysteine proteases